MSDWWTIISNAIWISGCALALAAVSYASWRASATGEQLRVTLRRPPLRVTTGLAGLLFCLGLAATSHSIVEILIGLILTFLFVVHLARDWRDLRRKAQT